VNTPSCEVAEKFSSYDLSIFSFGANPNCAEVPKVVSEGSSPSIGELWPDIDKLDEIRREDTSVAHTCDVPVHGWNVIASAEKADRHSRRSGDKVLLSNAPMLSNIKLKGHVSGSTRREAARIFDQYAKVICR
jgi:hypothetical protein